MRIVTVVPSPGRLTTGIRRQCPPAAGCMFFKPLPPRSPELPDGGHGRCGLGKTMAIVRDFDQNIPPLTAISTFTSAGAGMLQHIVQRLFKSQEHIMPHLGGKRTGRNFRRQPQITFHRRCSGNIRLA